MTAIASAGNVSYSQNDASTNSSALCSPKTSPNMVNGIAGDPSNMHQRRDQEASHTPKKHSGGEGKEQRFDNGASSSTSGQKERSRPEAKKGDDDDDDVPLLMRKQKVTPVSHTQNGHNNHSTLSDKKPDPNSVKLKIEKSPEKHDAPKVKVLKIKPVKNPIKEESDEEDDMSLSARAAKLKTESGVSHHQKSDHKDKKRKTEEKDDDEPKIKRSKSEPSSSSSSSKHKKDKEKDKKKKDKLNKTTTSAGTGASPRKRTKKEEEEEVWKWWEEIKHGDGVRWKFLQHKGPVFPPPYEPLPKDVQFSYNGKPMKLSSDTEEVATFYSKMIEHDYATKDVFNNNFFKDWRKVMTAKEREVITDLKKCDFRPMCEFFKKQSEERKNMSKEEKLKIKEEKDQVQKEYGLAILDGHKEKIGNFRIEPPGLFRGRGTHPKMGMLKKRVIPEDVIINCSKDSKVPQPPAGHKWKEVRHDNTVTWLASWTENIMGSIKYVMLNPSSKIKGEKDWQKYETARKLNKCVNKIREQYRADWKSKEMRLRQRAVAVYFIDKLALRAGNEKEEGETADTVGCCSLRCEHIKLYDEQDGQECVVEFDFLGKDSIRYYNRVPVEKRVFKNLTIFLENKDPGDDLFDRLNTTIVNKYLQSLMDGLTAKVFRTYNASHTLQEQLDKFTKSNMTVEEKMLAYNRANRQVAILCNHQRAVPKTHGKQMENLQSKITEKEDQVKAVKKELKSAKADCKAHKNEKTKKLLELKQRQVDRVEEQLNKLKLRATDKEENKEIALSTSKLNYLDPRISVAWCKKYSVPIEKIYNKTQREKFRWAIDMAGPEFVF